MRSNSLILLTVAHHWQSVVALRRGDLVDAQAQGQRALASMGTEDWELYGPWIDANLALVALELGEVEAAREVLGPAPARRVDPIGHCLQLESRGRLALARVTPPLRWSTSLLPDARSRRWACRAPVSSLAFGRGQAAAALGDLTLAAELGAQELELARRTGTGRALGIALRTAP